MNGFPFKRIGYLLTFLTIGCGYLAATNPEVPCVVFSGNADSDINIDLSKYKRITFLEDSFIISSPENDDCEDISLGYSDFHHFSFQNTNPTAMTEVKEIESVGKTGIFYSASEKIIKAQFSEENILSLTILNPEGQILLTSELSVAQPIYVGNLTPGVYIAVATDGDARYTIKFILE